MRKKTYPGTILLLALAMLSSCREAVRESPAPPILSPPKADLPCFSPAVPLHSPPESTSAFAETPPSPPQLLSAGARDLHQLDNAVFTETGDDGTFTYDLYDLYAEVTGFSPRYRHTPDTAASIHIPQQYGDLPVRTVAEDAFSAERGIMLISVTFPEGLWRIGARAFLNQTMLTSVILPDTILYIEEMAFVTRDGDTEYIPALFLDGVLLTPGGKAFTNEKRFDASR